MLLASSSANTLETLSIAGGALGALMTAAGLARKIRPAVRRRIHRMDRLDQLLGDPDTSPPLPGVLEHVAALRDEIAEIRDNQEAVRALAAELVPNSGGSFRDAYNRDQLHQNLVNEALGRALGVTLPTPPPRVVHHHDDEDGE